MRTRAQVKTEDASGARPPSSPASRAPASAKSEQPNLNQHEAAAVEAPETAAGRPNKAPQHAPPKRRAEGEQVEFPGEGSVVWIAAEALGCRSFCLREGQVEDADDDVFEYEGAYRLGSILDEGSYGRVYRAQKITETESTLNYAIKIVKSLAPTALNKIFDEFKLQHSTRCTHVVKGVACGVLSPLGVGEEHPFLLMPMGGKTLPEWISHREPSVTARDFLNEAAELMRQLAVGLRAMHDTGFAHPDLKPENLVVEEESGVFVIKMFHFGSTIHEGRVGTSPAGYEYSGTFPYSGPDHIISRFMIPIRDFLDSKEGKRWLKSLDDSAWRTFSTDRKTLYSAYEEMRCYTQASVLPLSRSRPPTPASRPGDPRRRNLFAYFAILLQVLLGHHGFEHYLDEVQAVIGVDNVKEILLTGVRAVNFYKHVVIPAFRDEKREPSELKLGSSRRLGYSTISWLPNVLAQLLTVYDDPDTGFAGESNLMGEIVHIISPSSSSAITTIAPRYRGTAADETLPSAASSSEDVETAAVADFALRTRQDVLNHASKLEMAQGVTKHQQAQAVVLAYEGDAWRMKTGKCFTLSPKGEDLLYPSDAGRYRLRPLFERYTTDELVTRFRNKGTLTGTFQIYG